MIIKKREKKREKINPIIDFQVLLILAQRLTIRLSSRESSRMYIPITQGRRRFCPLPSTCVNAASACAQECSDAFWSRDKIPYLSRENPASRIIQQKKYASSQGWNLDCVYQSLSKLRRYLVYVHSSPRGVGMNVKWKDGERIQGPIIRRKKLKKERKREKMKVKCISALHHFIAS